MANGDENKNQNENVNNEINNNEINNNEINNEINNNQINNNQINNNAPINDNAPNNDDALNNNNNQPKAPDEQEKKENIDKKDAKMQDDVYVEMFVSKLKTFNDMYKTKISRDKLASTVSDAWQLLTNEDAQKKEEGKKLLNGLFDAMLEHTFEVEKNAAYKDGRFPEYTEIITSANDLLRAAMFSFTDLYRDNSRAQLFAKTAIGGLTKDEMAKLTMPNELWKLDQKSDEAWEIQSRDAKEVASEWQKNANPAQAVVKAMDELIEKNNSGTLNRRDVLKTLAAAEWTLLNDDKMVVEDENDPYNRTPKWNNRYWKAVTEAREAIGIPKHISIRELIQGNYGVMQKAMQNENYHKDHIQTEIINPEKRAAIDSMDKQKEVFTIQRENIATKDPANEAKILNAEMDSVKVRISIEEENEYKKARTGLKNMNFITEKEPEKNLNSQKQESKI